MASVFVHTVHVTAYTNCKQLYAHNFIKLVLLHKNHSHHISDSKSAGLSLCYEMHYL